MTSLRLSLFGGFDCRTASGTVVVLPTRKSRAVFAYLAMTSGVGQSREKLAAFLWEENTDSQARANLRKTLSRLRKALSEGGADCLIADPKHVGLRPDSIEVDALLFAKFAAEGTPEGLERAASLYGGEFLENCADCGESFEAWLMTERRRLEESARSVFGQLLDHYAASGATDRAIQVALKLLALDPLQESVHRTLMRLYLYQDRIGSALRQYEDCRNLLARELDIEPGAETESLRAELLEKAPRYVGNHVEDGLPDSSDRPEQTSVSETATEGHVRRRPAPPGCPSIAVLPFTNMSGDRDQDYFADGITEDIITDLSKLSNLYVAARSSAFLFKGAQVRIEQIAAELRVRFLLEGSVRKADNHVRITAQLIDSATGGQVWAERYDRQLTNIFELQDEISGSIVDALEITISPSEECQIEGRPTHDVDAYQAYLRGRSFLREMTRRSVELARQLFKQAVDVDPRYAQAFSGLADCASMLAFHYKVEPHVLDDAIESSRRALEIDPTLAESHASYGRVLWLKGDEESAEREFRNAIRLDPNLYEAPFYWGLMYLTSGRAEESLPLLRKAFDLAEHDLQVAMMLSSAYRGLGREKDLKDTAKSALNIAEQRIRLNPEDERAAYVGAMALLDLGEIERARQWAEMAAAIGVGDSRASYNLSCLFALLGEADQALVLLEHTLKTGCSAQKRDWMFNDPDMAIVRQDPRFRKLLAAYT